MTVGERSAELTARTYPVPDTPFGLLERDGDWVPIMYWPDDHQPLCNHLRWSNPAALVVELASLWAALTPGERAVLAFAAAIRAAYERAKHPSLSAKVVAFLKTADGGR